MENIPDCVVYHLVQRTKYGQEKDWIVLVDFSFSSCLSQLLTKISSALEKVEKAFL